MGPPPVRRPAPAGRISSAGGAPRPALGRLGKARGEGGSRLRPRALQRPPARTSPLPGAVDSVLAAPSLPLGGGTGPLAPGATDDRGGLSSVRLDRVASPRAGIGPRFNWRQGSAAMSATHPTRLETRTKESNARASQRVRLETPWRNESEGRRAPAEVGSRPPFAGGLRAHHRPVSPASSGRWSVSACDRTRKMVNYAWAGRSQRKLWWRPAAVLTCKSVVRPGYRGERLIEPSSSWFLPKFPPGKLALRVSQFYLVKRMIRGLGAETISTYSQTLNG